MMVASADELRHAMAEALTAGGALLSGPWRAAFADVPRHVFLPRFFRQSADRRGWEPIDSSHPDWLRLIYTDATLVTQLNKSDEAWEVAVRDGQVAGVPTSSSSAPGLMALMLEALDVRDGHAVLEVGTGTGYNAALLCHRLGNGNVTTVEVDPGLAARARERLHTAGYHPAVITGDGSLGHPAGGRYDRLIATASMARVPTAWLGQVAAGGVILASLHRDLGGGALVRLTVGESGAAQGRFLPHYGGFMPVRAHPPADAQGLLDAALSASHRPGQLRHTDLTTEHLDHPDFGMLAALLLPGVTSIGFTPQAGPQRWLLHPDGSWAALQVDAGRVGQHGDRRLWSELEAIHARWQQWGQPSRDRFGLTVTTNGDHTLWLDHPTQPAAPL